MKNAGAKLAEKALIKNDWPMKEIGGLTLLFSPLLSQIRALTHAFTTRLGGESKEPLASFNLGRHWSTEQSRADATMNRSRLCHVLSLNFSHLVVPGQVHSTRIAWVTDPESFPDVDAVATVSTNTPILLHFADCVPIILFDRELSALCVLHAGWRGTAGGIATKGVRLLEDVLDLQPANMVAAVGPAIGSCCYPVSGDVAEKLRTSVKDSAGLVLVKDGIAHPDLKAINALQLLESGVAEVDVNSYCTACHPEIFYSHRQSAGQTGRQGAIAGIHEVI